ncbi:MAG: septum formation initiator family protein [Spirochaetaceae bacterium]|nr:septum formation initiator family protein [Spirochaetaceae bacterium]
MKALKYLAALWVSILVHSLLSFFAGSAGLSAYDQLKAETARQEANLEALQRTTGELEGEKAALLNDPQTIRVKARELGYGGPEEQFVRIVGLSRPMRQRYNAGQSIDARPPEFLPESTIRLVSLLAGGITLVFLLICRSLKMLL